MSVNQGDLTQRLNDSSTGILPAEIDTSNSRRAFRDDDYVERLERRSFGSDGGSGEQHHEYEQQVASEVGDLQNGGQNLRPLRLEKKYHSDVLHRAGVIKAPEAAMRQSFVSKLESHTFKKTWVLYQIVKLGMDDTAAELVLQKIDYENIDKENLLPLVLDRMTTQEERFRQEQDEMLSMDLGISQMLTRAKRRLARIASLQRRDSAYLPAYARRQQNQLNQQHNNEQDIESQKDYPMCDVCYTNCRPELMLRATARCECTYCRDCLVQHVDGLIGSGRVLELVCPNDACREPLAEQDVQQICIDDSALLDKYRRIRAQALYAKDPLVKWCTRPGCETPIRAASRSAATVTCPSCQQVVCFKCGTDDHPGQSCEDVVGKMYADAKKKFRIHPCPQCRSPIQKSSGCNHMTCWSCKHQFCWLCFRPYNYNHYKAWNLCCGCPGAQFTEGKPNRCKILCACFGQSLLILLAVLAYIALGVLALALYPLFCAFMLPKIVYGWCDGSWWEECFGYGCLAKTMYTFVAIILLPIFLPFAVFPGYFFIYCVIRDHLDT